MITSLHIPPSKHQLINGKIEMNLLDTFGGRLELARRAKDMNQTQLRERLLAEKGIEIGSAHWSRIENNRVGMSLDLFRAVCELLEESADWLLFGKMANHVDDGVGISEEGSEVARIIDNLDTDYRKFVYMIARQCERWNDQRNRLISDDAAMKMDFIDGIHLNDDSDDALEDDE